MDGHAPGGDPRFSHSPSEGKLKFFTCNVDEVSFWGTISLCPEERKDQERRVSEVPGRGSHPDPSLSSRGPKVSTSVVGRTVGTGPVSAGVDVPRKTTDGGSTVRENSHRQEPVQGLFPPGVFLSNGSLCGHRYDRFVPCTSCPPTTVRECRSQSPPHTVPRHGPQSPTSDPNPPLL